MNGLNGAQLDVVRETIRLHAGAQAPRKKTMADVRAGNVKTKEDMLDLLPPPAHGVFIQYVNDLPAEDRAMLMALMEIGRDGDTTPKDYELLYGNALRSTEHMGEYLEGKGPLKKYLTDGVRAFGIEL